VVKDAAPKTLSETLSKLDDTGKQRMVLQMSINLIPIMEKGLLDPIIVHRCGNSTCNLNRV
jgi:hypothetical protein